MHWLLSSLSVASTGLKSDVALGLYLVRGDAMVLFGEVDDAKEEAQNLTDATPEEVRDALDAQKTSDGSARKTAEWDFEKLERI